VKVWRGNTTPTPLQDLTHTRDGLGRITAVGSAADRRELELQLQL